MAISTFDKRLFIEQIRYLEAEKMLADDTGSSLHDSSSNSQDNFEDKLWHRASRLIKQHHLSLILSRAAGAARIANIFLILIAALLGTMGVSYAMSASHTINIYWLLLVLLAFNFVSMLLWLVAINLSRQGMWQSLISRLMRWLSSVMDTKGKGSHTFSQQLLKRYYREADRAWFKYHFTEAIGRWRLSKITHQLWLAYLFSGLIFLMLTLSVRQYDFVWGTTLLSDSVFIKLTELLSAPLHVIGFSPPSIEQIQATRIGSGQVLNDVHRFHWAQFLLGALLCFGVLPRLLLWLFSAMRHAQARKQLKLDFYHPYYIHLRQQLMPLASHGQIIDADNSPLKEHISPAKNTLDKISTCTSSSRELPADMRWVAVELGSDLNWPALFVTAEYNLGQVTDRTSQSTILQALEEISTSSSLAIVVSGSRAPDRGVQRTVVNLLSHIHSEHRWLVLLKKYENESISKSRLAQWYQLAQSCDVPVDHVISLSEEKHD